MTWLFIVEVLQCKKKKENRKTTTEKKSTTNTSGKGPKLQLWVFRL